MQRSVPKTREGWGSKLGFILAAAGSAIGLGNIWRFPYTAGEGGGAVFVLIYLVFVVFLGFPVMVSEITIGRHAQRSTVGAYRSINGGRLWQGVGGLGVITGIMILSYYGVIAGWTVGYVVKVVMGQFAGGVDGESTLSIFSGYVSNPLWSLVGLFGFIALTTVVVLGGIKKGIERLSKILMPILLSLLVLVVIRSVTLPGAGRGIAFYLWPDFSRLSGEVLMEALGQAFFSLSLGMGVMITYGSYISKKEDIVTSAAWVCAFDSSIAFMAGLAIFPALFAIGLDPAQGPGLIFVVLPCVFDSIPLGQVFGFTFFLLLIMAALTSTISLLEVVTSYFVDERGMSRPAGALLAATLSFLVGIPSALSTGSVGTLTKMLAIGGEDKSFLDLMDLMFGNFSLVIGALFISVFTGWVWRRAEVLKELETGGRTPVWFMKVIYGVIRYLCPIGIFVLLLNLVLSLVRGG